MNYNFIWFYKIALFVFTNIGRIYLLGYDELNKRQLIK